MENFPTPCRILLQEKVSFEDSQKSLSDTIKLLDKAGEASPSGADG